MCVSDSDTADEQIDNYLSAYYDAPPEIMRRVMACFGGSTEEVAAFIKSYVDAGADHVVLRLVGDHASSLEALAKQRHLIG